MPAKRLPSKPATERVASVVTAAAVAASVVLYMTDVRRPTVPESAAYLVLTAASYMLSPRLPPVLALLFAVWVIKSMPTAEAFTIEAPHEPVEDRDAPIPDDGRARLAPTPAPGRRGVERALATPAMLHAAQSSAVPPRQ